MLIGLLAMSACAHAQLAEQSVPYNPTLSANSLAPRDQAIAWWLTSSGFVATALGGTSAALAAYAPAPERSGLRNVHWGVAAGLGAVGLTAIALGIALVTPKEIGPCEAGGTGFDVGLSPATQPASRPTLSATVTPGLPRL